MIFVDYETIASATKASSYACQRCVAAHLFMYHVLYAKRPSQYSLLLRTSVASLYII